MQTYWDHSNRERADMSREEVERFLDAELMTKGVLKVKAPELEPELEAPKLATKTYYSIEYHKGYRQKTGIVFESAELAQKFLELNPLVTDSLYIKGKDVHYVMPMADKSIVASDLSGEQDVLNNKSLIEKANAVRQLNELRRAEYNKKSVEMQKVLNGVWDDWATQRDDQAAHKRVIDTFEEYKRMANNSALAAQFLAKAFSDEQITEAFEWFGIDKPSGVIVEALTP